MTQAFNVLIEDRGDSLPLTDELRRVYGGGLSLPATALYANFVQSIDGVVAMNHVESSGPVLSGKSPADRFVMGLLRATADAVLVGAGTLRDTPGHHWTADHIFPELKADWGKLRRSLGAAAQPRLVLVTSTGTLDVTHPAVRDGATFLTTDAGATILRDVVPGTCEIKAFDGPRVPMTGALQWLRQQGHRRILSEAGPRVTGQLLSESLLDDVFITVSPVLAGRDGGGRLSLVEGVELLPKRRLEPKLASARASDNFLMLRYSLD
ncbi:MAG TPA: dihydrofolate reductase family protein [Candidatus Dormibacteraeota bacterium]|nr:dihydrofolate reductase family protein [Candidatus Dormibacteraeota bacterium]